MKVTTYNGLITAAASGTVLAAAAGIRYEVLGVNVSLYSVATHDLAKVTDNGAALALVKCGTAETQYEWSGAKMCAENSPILAEATGTTGIFISVTLNYLEHGASSVQLPPERYTN
jgi:hypothetical protein